ncbi:MAG TPA: sigma-70 family RNA polymerase sigma factor [Candidatus Dormibacteraeota bacterium]|nr:sigma-70 family RNA polymerase sigma factor [Candidatus Dormibacteraeota bacterium]
MRIKRRRQGGEAAAQDCQTGSEAAGSSDEELLSGLVRDHGRAVMTTAMRSTGDLQAAQEVVQETFLRAWRHPQAFRRADSAPRAWLLTVARRLIADQWRSQTRRRQAELAASTEGPEVDHFDRVLKLAVVEQAVARLSSEHREVLIQCIWMDRSVSEVAAALDIPPGTVKSRAFYAIRSLRLILEELGYVP